jgi:hypothetical protein
MRLSFILARIAARTGVAVWRHRFGMLGALLVVGALGVYELTYAVPSVANGDCADMTMAAVTTDDDQTAHAAYACLGPGMRNATEDQFVAGMRQRALARGRASRVGDQRTPDGGHIVFFTVEQQGQAVGYIVYLNSQGKVVKVE